MKALLLIVISVLSLSFQISAQSSSISCPTVKLLMPNHLLTPGVEEKFGVEIVPVGLIQKLEFQWQVSAGNIVSGKSSSSPIIMAAKELAGSNIKITLTLSGVPTGCPSDFSDTIGVVPELNFDLVDVFGNIASDHVKAFMDNFFISINNYPKSEGAIRITFGIDEPERIRLQRLERIFNAVRFRDYDITRLTFVIEHDFAEPQTSLWTVPPGADLPGTREKTTLIKGEDLIKNPRKALPKKRT